jgi:hypothetical protein
MKPWELKEAELRAKENAYYNNLSPFMKAIDNNVWYCVGLTVLAPVCFVIGLGIGALL